jgi:hypothetical protein
MKKSGEWRVSFLLDYLLSIILSKKEHYHKPSFRPKGEKSRDSWGPGEEIV